MKRKILRRVLLLTSGLATFLAIAIPGGAASAAAPAGEWATFARCPVSAPLMLAADGVTTVDECIDSASASGTMTLGSTTVTLGATDLQTGVVTDHSTSPPVPTTVDPAGGAVVAAPVQIPGGLIGLMCPSNVPVITQLCDSITSISLNEVTATLEPAGNTSGLNLNGAISKGHPIITIPVKIQLSNPILGDSCFIGSDSDPVVLTIENSVAPPDGTNTRFGPDGVPVTGGLFQHTTSSGGTQVDSTFAVPGVNGCGGLLSPLVDPAVDLRAGLPATTGNSLTLNDPVLGVAAYARPDLQSPSEGQNYAAAFESSEG